MTSMIRLAIVGAFAILASFLAASPGTAQQERDPRLALVIGESAYQQDPLTTAANDAGLVANTLSEAGFEVIGARDLDQDALRRSLREFLDKAAAAGPNATVFVYFAGYGLQLEGENFLVPIGARITRDTEVPIEALRLSDFSRSLAAIPMKARILVLDAARAGPFAKSGPPLASGLALIDPDAGTLIAFNAAPGTVAPAESGSYGVYAQSLTEMMRDGGLPLGDVFARTRLRVTEKTKGAVVPWEANKVEQPLTFFNRATDAPPAVSAEQTAALKDRSIRELTPEEAYGIAVERDTIPAYEEFLAAFPNSPFTKRVHAMLAARREAVTWRRTVSANAPNAYWSYLKRYPNGPHAADARRRLTRLTAPLVPPPVFEAFDYDVPPPPPEEYTIVDRPVLIFDEPDFGPPPVVPVYLLPPPPDDWVALPPPPPPPAPFYLPIPIPIPIPIWSRPPHPPIAPPPLGLQPGTGRPLPPPTVPVGAGFIQPPQAIIARPPPTRPAALPGQPATTVPNPQLPTTQPLTTQPSQTIAPALGAVPQQPVKPGQLQPLPKPGQNATQPGPVQNPLPGTQPLPTPGANGLPAAAGGNTPPSKPVRGNKPGRPGLPVDQNAVTQPPAGAGGQPAAGIGGQPPAGVGGQPLVPPAGANGLPAATGGNTPPSKPVRGNKPGRPGLPVDQNAVTQPPAGAGGNPPTNGQTPAKANAGAGNPSAPQLHQQQLLQQKQQLDEQKAQQRSQQLQQQQLQQQQKVQQNLQQKNLQQQQQLEERKSQQQQLRQQQIQQQQMQRQEMQRQQQSQQQMRLQQSQQQRAQQQQMQLQQQRAQQQQQQRAQQQMQLQQQRAQQQQIQLQQQRAQQQAAHPNCGHPGQPPCPH